MEGLQVVNSRHCLHIVLVIGKYAHVFRGIFSGGGEGLGAEGYLGGPFQGGNFHMRREFSLKGAPGFTTTFKKQS